MTTPCPHCGSTKEPTAELVLLEENDEHVFYRCPECGHMED